MLILIYFLTFTGDDEIFVFTESEPQIRSLIERAYRCHGVIRESSKVQMVGSVGFEVS